MISCQQVALLLIDYVSNELPLEMRVAVEEHFHRCPPCVEYLRSYELTIEVGRKLPDPPLPAEFVSRLRTALGQAQPGAPSA